jgi:hypothetical protein
MSVRLRMTARQHEVLMRAVFPGDGLEAVAIALCGRGASGDDHLLVVRDVHPLPASAYRERHAGRVSWDTASILPLLDRADRERLGVLKVHSHPGGWDRFSHLDDAADRELFAGVTALLGDDLPNASMILLPDGRAIAREVTSVGAFLPVLRTMIVGDDIVSNISGEAASAPSFATRTLQAFGEKTYAALRALRVAVVGCSGTGCHVVEALVRLGVGEIVLIDPDRIDELNLDRITFARRRDIGRLKVERALEFIDELELATRVTPMPRNVIDRDVVRLLSVCDVVFGCMDGAEGRHALNRLATFYSLPYFDLGVRLDADGSGGVSQVCGGVHYVQPGGSSLVSRDVITLEEVRAEGLRRANPEQYEAQRRERYVHGVDVDRPAVIALNGHVAHLGVMELLARLHPFRDEPNERFAQHRVSLLHGLVLHEDDGLRCELLARHVGRGDVAPLLEMPALG